MLRQNAEVSGQLDRALDRITSCHKGSTGPHQRRLKEMLDKMTMTPWYSGHVCQLARREEPRRGAGGKHCRVVGFTPELDAGRCRRLRSFSAANST
jgi:hypothetical protein